MSTLIVDMEDLTTGNWIPDDPSLFRRYRVLVVVILANLLTASLFYQILELHEITSQIIFSVYILVICYFFVDEALELRKMGLSAIFKEPTQIFPWSNVKMVFSTFKVIMYPVLSWFLLFLLEYQLGINTDGYQNLVPFSILLCSFWIHDFIYYYEVHGIGLSLLIPVFLL